MKYLIVLFMATQIYAGFNETKKAYGKKLKALRLKYVLDLKADRRKAIRYGKSVKAIDKEIKRINVLISKPFRPETYQIRYTTGIRHYEFRTHNKLYFREGRKFATYERTEKQITIYHETSVEIWELKANGSYDVVFDNKRQLIKGKAKKL